MIAPVDTITSNGTALQKPIALCQFHSRARPRNFVLISRPDFRLFVLQLRGSQRTKPLTTKNKNPRLHAPVIARPVARFASGRPSQRCQSLIVRKSERIREQPSPRFSPETALNKSAFSLPKLMVIG